MQNCGMAPHFVTWAEGLSTEAVGEDLFFGLHLILGQKNGLNLSEDLFYFFWSSPNFEQKNGLGFGLENFHSGLYNSQIPRSPPFRKSCVRY